MSPALRAWDATVTSAQVEEFVRRASRAALKARIEQERDVVEYMEILAFIGPQRGSTSTHSWVGDVLQESRPARDRLRDVSERLRFGGDEPDGQ